MCPVLFPFSPFLDTRFHKDSQPDLIQNAGEAQEETERVGDQCGKRDWTSHSYATYSWQTSCM